MLCALVTDFICHYSLRATKIAIKYPSRGEVHPAGYASQIAVLTETLKEPNFGLGPAKIRTLLTGNLKQKSAVYSALLVAVLLRRLMSNFSEYQTCFAGILRDLRDYSVINVGYDEFRWFIKQAYRSIIVGGLTGQ